MIDDPLSSPLHILVLEDQHGPLAPFYVENHQFSFLLARITTDATIPMPTGIGPQSLERGCINLADDAFTLLNVSLTSKEKLSLVSALYVIFDRAMEHNNSEYIRERFWDLVIGKGIIYEESVATALTAQLSRALDKDDRMVQRGALIGLSNIGSVESMDVASRFAALCTEPSLRKDALLASRGDLP